MNHWIVACRDRDGRSRWVSAGPFESSEVAAAYGQAHYGNPDDWSILTMQHPMSYIQNRAMLFAWNAHAGQLRKYTGRPYFDHILGVAQIVKGVEHTPEMLAAAYLHDTVEDTAVTHEEIAEAFGPEVAAMVWALTKVPLEAGNRAARKRLDAERLGKADAAVQTIKLADLIHNLPDIVEHDPKFAVTFLAETKELLAVLTKGDPALMARAQAMVEAAELS